MKIDRITYQKIFPTGMMYLNHKIGVEVQVDDRDDIDEAYAFARRTVEGWNSTSNPGMAVAMEYMVDGKQIVPVVGVEKTSEERRVAVMIQDMMTCKDLKTLETYKFLLKKFPQMEESYNQKLKELNHV